MNKQIKGAQCTITWHVDDLKLLHTSPDVLEELLEHLKSRIWNDSPTGDEQGYHS